MSVVERPRRPASPSGAPPDPAPFLERLFDRVPEEGSYRIQPVDGALPRGLRGTYYVNGPGRFGRGEVAYRHWLDGDGLVCSLRFDAEGDAGVRFTSRFVRSAKWRDEEAAGRALYRTFGTAFAGDRLVRGIALASPVNVSVYPFTGRLLAFGEQGLPWELDPETLETRGEHDFGRRLNPVTPFSAHPNFDPVSGEMFNFGVSFAAERPTLNLYRFAPDGELVYRRRTALPYPASIHDFGLSRRFAVVFVQPYLLDMAALTAEGATVLDGLSWEPERGSELLVLDRESGAPVCRLAAGRGYVLHQVNAFEEGGHLVVDLLELEEPVYPDYRPLPDLFAEVAPAHPVRLVVDLAAGRLRERREVPCELAADFPAVDPRRWERRADRFWMLAVSATGRPGRKFLDRVAAVDFGARAIADAWQAPAGRYLGGEPVFAPDPERPEGGWVLCQELDAEARRAAFLVFDAHDLAAGPLARLPLQGALPPLFHACFLPETGASDRRA